MSRETALARGRAFVEKGLHDRCTIHHDTGGTTDDTTGEVTPALVLIYDGPCRFQQRDAMGQRTDSAEASIVVLRLELQLPVVGSEGVERGHIVTATLAVNDSALLGRTFTIRDLAHKSDATARRVTIEEQT